MSSARPHSLHKSEILDALSEATGLTKVQVNSVLEALRRTVARSLLHPETETIVIPGLCEITRRQRLAWSAGCAVSKSVLRLKPAASLIELIERQQSARISARSGRVVAHNPREPIPDRPGRPPKKPRLRGPSP